MMNHVFFLHHVDGRVFVSYLERQHQDALWEDNERDTWDNVLLGNLGSIHLDVTSTPTTNLNIDADQEPTFMETFFPSGPGLFEQDNYPCHKAKML